MLVYTVHQSDVLSCICSGLCVIFINVAHHLVSDRMPWGFARQVGHEDGWETFCQAGVYRHQSDIWSCMCWKSTWVIFTYIFNSVAHHLGSDWMPRGFARLVRQGDGWVDILSCWRIYCARVMFMMPVWYLECICVILPYINYLLTVVDSVLLLNVWSLYLHLAAIFIIWNKQAKFSIFQIRQMKIVYIFWCLFFYLM